MTKIDSFIFGAIIGVLTSVITVGLSANVSVTTLKVGDCVRELGSNQIEKITYIQGKSVETKSLEYDNYYGYENNEILIKVECK